MHGYTALYFLRESCPYNPAMFNTMCWDPDWYVKVLTYPQAEMMDATPSGFAGTFFTCTTSLAWHNKLRRTVRPGDAFTFNAQHWLYIPATHVDAFNDHDTRLVSDWEDMHLRITAFIPEHNDDQYDRRSIPLHNHYV